MRGGSKDVSFFVDISGFSGTFMPKEVAIN